MQNNIYCNPNSKISKFSQCWNINKWSLLLVNLGVPSKALLQLVLLQEGSEWILQWFLSSFLLRVWTLSWKRRGLSESRNIFEISLSWDTLMNTLIAWKSIVYHWISLRFHSFYTIPQMIHSWPEKRQQKLIWHLKGHFVPQLWRYLW